MAGEGNGGPNRINTMHVGNKGVLTTLQLIDSAKGDVSKGVLKEMNKTAELLIINIGEITKKLRDPKKRKDGLKLLKEAFEKVLAADGGKLLGARCEFDEKKPELSVIFAEGKEFAKISADWKSVRVLQNGETKELGNYDMVQKQEVSRLINELAEQNGVKVELTGTSS